MGKFRVTLKDPDGVFESVREYAESIAAQAKAIPAVAELSPGDWAESIRSALSEKISRWVKYGEYVTIEFDTEAGTATVVEAFHG